MKRLLEGLNGPVASVPARAKTIPSHRILVVEDQPALRSLSAQVLVRSGYEVDVAEDGMAGWEALRAESYDLLITDNQMPRLSGLELVDRKSTRLNSSHVRISYAVFCLKKKNTTTTIHITQKKKNNKT